MTLRFGVMNCNVVMVPICIAYIVLVNSTMLIKLYVINFLVSRDPILVKKIGAATALEVRATGIPYVFAPCIAVSNLN